MNHTFDAVGQMDLQKSLKWFAIHFDSFGPFNHALYNLYRIFHKTENKKSLDEVDV